MPELKRLNVSRLLVSGTLCTVFFIARPGVAAYEGASFGVNNFNGTDECPCGSWITLPFPPYTQIWSSCSDLTWPYTMAAIFTSELDAMGYPYGLNIAYANKAVDPEDWVDPWVHPDGEDFVSTTGTDWADAVFLSTHGTRKCQAPQVNSSFVLGDSHGPLGGFCTVNTQDHIRLGDVDTEVVLFASCNSQQKCVWQAHGYDFPFAGPELTMSAGFHGISYGSSDAAGRLEDYMEDTETTGIGEYWVDYMTDLDDPFDPIPADQCATLVIHGASYTARQTFYLDAGFKDFYNTGAHTGTSWRGWGGCDPDDGDAL